MPEADLTRAVEAGLTKVNIATHLNVAYTRAIRDHLAAHPEAVDPRRYIAAAREAVAREVARLLPLLRAVAPDAPSDGAPPRAGRRLAPAPSVDMSLSSRQSAGEVRKGS
ncbi:ketose-bisphosphate aldolase [Streptomyces sparsogenes DSM 40356]|uniref:Ketose-bisphosphate aldolase n=1 Tax=Streptomyces sparsogenes DSM 40356 TaxID=1331668 RepID=A0A1R1SCQ7_9ACTN|nr:ketose-bisphosphate aldolase [Streptomyces sparsogenes DSM 40356]